MFLNSAYFLDPLCQSNHLLILLDCVFEVVCVYIFIIDCNILFYFFPDEGFRNIGVLREEPEWIKEMPLCGSEGRNVSFEWSLHLCEAKAVNNL